MGYANPVEHMGVAAFAARAQEAGVDGVLIVDYPPGGERGLGRGAGRPPASTRSSCFRPRPSEARIELVSRMAKGYIYYVSLKGVTGAAHIDTADVERMLARIRARTNVPVGVGFGIRDAARPRGPSRASPTRS